jgi:hypothetical protein
MKVLGFTICLKNLRNEAAHVVKPLGLNCLVLFRGDYNNKKRECVTQSKACRGLKLLVYEALSDWSMKPSACQAT